MEYPRQPRVLSVLRFPQVRELYDSAVDTASGITRQSFLSAFMESAAFSLKKQAVKSTFLPATALRRASIQFSSRCCALVHQAAASLGTAEELRAKVELELHEKRGWIEQTIAIAAEAHDPQHEFLASRLTTLTQARCRGMLWACALPARG